MIVQNLSVISAPSSPDPYPYYRELAAHRPFAYDGELGAWVAASVEAVQAVLEDERMQVRPASEPVPAAMVGTALGDMYSALARMTEGTAHVAGRTVARSLLERITPANAQAIAFEESAALSRDMIGGDCETLSELLYDVPVRSIARLFEIDSTAEVLRTAHAFARALSPSADSSQIAEGVRGAERLLALLRRSRDARTAANLLGFFFQGYDAIAGSIGNAIVAHLRCFATHADLLVEDMLTHDPPIHNTRRFAHQAAVIGGERIAAGDMIVVILPHTPFGYGRHSCPGEAIARAIAVGAVSALLADATTLGQFSLAGYRPLPNARVPKFVRQASKSAI